jgi:hypothetical protein
LRTTARSICCAAFEAERPWTGPRWPASCARTAKHYRRGHTLSATQARAWRAIVDCRTAALGGVRERCANCGAERHVWRSCRNRHCPQCQTRAKEAWRAARLREVLPVPYAHWVFTLPHALNPLAIRHPRWLYGALFDSAAATLLELAANPRWLGAVPGFSLVLHTWSQDLRMHLHVHALITCGGLDAEGRWRTPVRGTRFLFPVQAASKVFRGKFLARLDAAHRSGELPDDPHAAPGAWQARRRALLAHDWVVYAKPPPGGPAQVLDYLARYTHRVALSNDRLLGCDAGEVRLRVRDNETGGKRTVSLPGDTSSDASCATCCRPASSVCATTGCSHAAQACLACRRTRGAPGAGTATRSVIEAAEDFLARVTGADPRCCPHCGVGRWHTVEIVMARRYDPPAPAPRCRDGPP